jgi:hypothetical protein
LVQTVVVQEVVNVKALAHGQAVAAKMDKFMAVAVVVDPLEQAAQYT